MKRDKNADTEYVNEPADAPVSHGFRSNDMPRKPGGVSLQIMLSAVIFVVISATMLIMGLTVFTLLHLGIISQPAPPAFPGVIIMIAVLSTVVGTVISLLFGRFPLRPLHRVISAMREVAGGNFSTRLEVRNSGGELNELCRSFNAMAEELQGLEILRGDFINNFSHEFKTPIASIRGFARILKNPGLTEEEREEYLNIIISESERLSDLSTSVLNLSRLENQKIISDAATFGLSEQIRRIILILQPKWEAKDLEFEVDMEDCNYCGSQNLLSQVWLNLLDNAVKFTPEKGQISVKLQPQSGGVIILIKNTGPHISEKGLARIFEKFYQDDPSRSAVGNGLGLSMVSKIVALHRGSVSARNLPEGGVEFRVELPGTDPPEV